MIEISTKEWKTTPGGQDACWLYAIDFIEKKPLEFTNLYIYRVSFCWLFFVLNYILR
jgi:hypothetical protein